MKGIQGLVVAAILGGLAVVLNYIYLHNKTKDVKSETFLGIADDVTIKKGDKFKDSHFTAVNIPITQNARELKDFVYTYAEKNTLLTIETTRRYSPGDLVYRSDFRTEPDELALEEGQRLIWVPVNSQSFVPDLVDPGDQISFIFPKPLVAAARPPSLPPNDTGIPAPAGAPATSRSDGEMIVLGPFTVGSLGRRLGSVNTANRGRNAQERQVGVVVQSEGTNQLEREAMRLLEFINSGSVRSVSVMLHPKN